MRRKHALIGLGVGLTLALASGCETAQFASHDRVHTVTSDAPVFTLVSEQRDDNAPVHLGAGDDLGSALFDRYIASLEQPVDDADAPRVARGDVAVDQPAHLRLRTLVMDWLNSDS
ncbi:MAG: hypothetical protein WD009_02540 [Phycisphaeraceae bacterium]